MTARETAKSELLVTCGDHGPVREKTDYLHGVLHAWPMGAGRTCQKFLQ